jgi:deoxyribodipyrimidine photo-lyase
MQTVEKPNVNIFWFRRDLRLNDNHGFQEALQSGVPVQGLFIFDTEILDKLEDRDDARVQFIHDTLSSIQKDLEAIGGTLDVRYGSPNQVWKELISEYDVSKVFYNIDFEPYARQRDASIETLLSKHEIEFSGFLDHLIFHPDEVLKGNGEPYVVFTPYSKVWKKLLFPDDEFIPGDLSVSNRFEGYHAKIKSDQVYQTIPKRMISLADMEFRPSKMNIPPCKIKEDLISKYSQNRDFPGRNGTSMLGVHLRFGTISVRQLARIGAGLNDTYLNELIWREFYAMILYHFPFVVERSFRAKYDRIEWRNDPNMFMLWCNGETGYPMVDAGMRQLNQTGYMHNRVRMVVASFLTKHLLIDWRWGERYFARKLLDFELASNNGGWQWAAGCGTDAAPYFRIFNPESQMKKFDPQLVYIHKWVPEYGTDKYPPPIVDHKMARVSCLRTYRDALG